MAKKHYRVIVEDGKGGRYTTTEPTYQMAKDLARLFKDCKATIERIEF